MSQMITRRIVWRAAQDQYYLLCLLSMYLNKVKLLMRNLSLENGQVASGDDAIPGGIKKDFMAILKDMKALKDITFPRTICQPCGIPGRSSSSWYSEMEASRHTVPWHMSDGTSIMAELPADGCLRKRD